MKKIAKSKAEAKMTVKVSRLAKAWRDFAKNKNNDEKLIKFYEIFLNTNFWIKLHSSEEKNFVKYKKYGIKANEKFRASLASDGTIPLFEVHSELIRMLDDDRKRNEKEFFGTVQQHGGEVIYSFSKNTEYSIKIKGVRDFVHIHTEGVAFMMKNFKQPTK